MQVSHHAALAFVAAVSFCWPGFAAEPNAPTALITQTESLRFSVEDRLQASPPSRKAERDALILCRTRPGVTLGRSKRRHHTGQSRHRRNREGGRLWPSCFRLFSAQY